MTLTYRTGFFVALGALAISLYVQATARPVRPVGVAPPPPASLVPTSSGPSARPNDLTTCVTQLARCRDESWNVVAKSIASDLESHATRAPAPKPAADPGETTGPEDQKRVRCDIAEQQAREHWVSQRTNIHKSVRDVGKPEWVKTETAKYLDDLEKKLGANKTERARFERGYQALWDKHGPAIQKLLASDPIDDIALLESVKAYWHDEDAMVESVMGPAALTEYRASELRSRTAIAAILASLGDKPWGDQLVW